MLISDNPTTEAMDYARALRDQRMAVVRTARTMREHNVIVIAAALAQTQILARARRIVKS